MGQLTVSEWLKSLEENLEVEGCQEGGLGIVSDHINHVYL